MSALIGLFLLFFGAAYLALLPDPPDGRDQSLDWNRRCGNYRVRYADGQISQPFSREVAYDYAEIFGGTVIRKDGGEL